MAGIFAQWQTAYEEAGIAVFPVDVATKKPAISNYMKVGQPGSSELARKYPDANGLGFACGKRNRLTILDIDAAGEKPLADALDKFGPSSIIARTASDKHHVWYRYNGEGRKIRPDPAMPIDILGGGFAVAPPSVASNGAAYRFIQGSLADIGSLPCLQMPPVDVVDYPEAANGNDLVPVGERNPALFHACLRAARSSGSLTNLVAYAHELNRCGLSESLPDAEVIRAATSAWSYEVKGRNWVGRGQVVNLPHEEIDRLLPLGSDAVALFLRLRRHNWGNSFIVANAMAETMPDGKWTPKRFARARGTLVAAGEIVELRPASRQHGPALYRFG